MLQLQTGLIVEQRAVDDAAFVRQLAKIDIFGDGHLRDQMQLLIDNRHAGVERRHRISERHLLAADLQVASGGDVVTAENFQQRRFACAIFAHQLFFEVIAGNQHHIGHRSELRRLNALGDPVVEHFTGFIAMDVRAWQQGAIEAGRLRLRQFVDSIHAVDANTNHIRRFKALPFCGTHAAKHSVIVHPNDQPVFHLRVLDQH